MKLFEARVGNLIVREARDRNEEEAGTNAVREVFGHNDYDRLPDTKADPPHPGWIKVDSIMAAYHARREEQDRKYCQDLREHR